MNASLIILEIAVALLGLGLLLVDLWTPAHLKRSLGYVAAAGVALILLASLGLGPGMAFGQMYVLDSLALFFKRFFLFAAVLVLLISVEYSDRIQSGIAEFYALVLFALCGMLFAASANDFLLVFVSLELITTAFYVLNSFQRARLSSLEAGLKYLIMGALATAFTVYGIAFIFGTTGKTNFTDIASGAATVANQPVFLLGLLLVMVGIGFKIAAFPFQSWAPDVYQGSPAPAAAFLAVGSKAAGIVLLVRVLFSAVPAVTPHWAGLLMLISAATILYGNLCAIPQRNLKRLLGYSSIAHAGYLLLGVVAMNAAGVSAILYYLSGYLFTALAAFMVVAIVMRNAQDEDISALAGLPQRSPLLATALTLSMVSLAGIPPLAGFFGKFLLFRGMVERGGLQPAYYGLIGIALLGVVISFYYYLGVVRVMFWSDLPGPAAPIHVSWPSRGVLIVCIVGMIYLGVFPNRTLNASGQATKVLSFAPSSSNAVASLNAPLPAPPTGPAR
jgi:NADH-quinone oxidoreductase subunit N